MSLIRLGELKSEAELMLQVVSDSGVPREAILVEERSRTTFENVTNSICAPPRYRRDRRDRDGSARLVPLAHEASVADRPEGIPARDPAPVLPARGILHRQVMVVVARMPHVCYGRGPVAVQFHRGGYPDLSLGMKGSRPKRDGSIGPVDPGRLVGQADGALGDRDRNRSGGSDARYLSLDSTSTAIAIRSLFMTIVTASGSPRHEDRARSTGSPGSPPVPQASDRVCPDRCRPSGTEVRSSPVRCSTTWKNFVSRTASRAC